MYTARRSPSDRTGGLQNGDAPLATVTFSIVGQGETQIVNDVITLHDVTRMDINARAVSTTRAETATGTAGPTMPMTTTTPVAVTTYPTVNATLPLTAPVDVSVPPMVATTVTTGITTWATVLPVPAGTGGPGDHDAGENTIVTRAATPTAPPTVNMTLQAATAASEATRTATAIPTATRSGPAFALAAIGALGFVGLAARRRWCRSFFLYIESLEAPLMNPARYLAVHPASDGNTDENRSGYRPPDRFRTPSSPLAGSSRGMFPGQRRQRNRRGSRPGPIRAHVTVDVITEVQERHNNHPAVAYIAEPDRGRGFGSAAHPRWREAHVPGPPVSTSGTAS